MGTCCSYEVSCGRYGGSVAIDMYENESKDSDGNDVTYRDGGARARLRGFSRYVSMYTQQGKKGFNQDAMTVWEDFAGEKGMIFCGVFDGHGPHGHKVARHVRDLLPSRLSAAIRMSQLKGCKYIDGHDYNNNGSKCNMSLASWEGSFVKSFGELDEKLSQDSSIDSFYSGSTAVTVVKQGNHLMIANVGDSRAVLCTRGDNNQLIPIQLTVDLKPDIPAEAERIKNCKGRIFAIPNEPDVSRVWMPDEDCPGLAMARALGDFCLKNYGLSSIPDVSYRELTDKDEFVVLATDGVWDVLSNSEVIRIVASATTQSMAAKMVVKHAVRTWRFKYPDSKVDDCAVICLFLKSQPISNHFAPKVTGDNVKQAEHVASHGSKFFNNQVPDSVIGGTTVVSKEDLRPLEGLSRANTAFKLPRILSRRKSSRSLEGVEVQQREALVHG
ncbi:putative Protein phosphatase-2c [Quillaja saponaria]|uniref:PPM-type phosphatase domain-containing protein n=1 Tax=Quillaja saponaria TaxID=32244 RepID=A0AAD7L209_QUISA|nr:putative Protein phosphatase-2c [Quillaja saponaria]